MLRVINLFKSFKIGDNEFVALKDINLEIKKGEFVAIIGQSGSGKSTLMNILGCLDKPTNGDYFVDGVSTSNFTADELANLRSKKFGFVFQRYNLVGSINALQNVALPAIYAGDSKKHREKRAMELLAHLDLAHKANSRPNELSGGQQQRVSIARALMNGGEIILADEPTGALDSKSGEVVMEIIKDLHKMGHTIILVTHDKKIADFANRVIEISDGSIKSDITKSSEVFELEPKQKIHKNFIQMIKDQFIESFKMSINAILTHKLRSLLTMLGIIIGISSVIAIVALGTGSTKQIIENISMIGTNTITIFPGKGFGDMRSGRVRSLSLSDSEILNKQDYLEYSTPNAYGSGTITYKNISSTAQIVGGGVNTLNINGLNLQFGRNFKEDDITFSNSVAIIDANTKEQIFKNEDPIGKAILFNKRPLKIIGVLEDDSRGDVSNLRVYAPYSTVVNKITGDKLLGSITVKVGDDVNPQLAEKLLTDLLIKKHGKKDFFTRNSDSIRQTIEKTLGTMRIFISSIAVISLVVGGIGVMNIMLVSVTERTKEIGIRMAIGAKQLNIMMQFLIEAILLCAIGGVVGLAIAYFIGFICNNYTTEYVMIFSLAPTIIAFLSSTLIGVFFGFVPAKNASKLNPIQALMQE